MARQYARHVIESAGGSRDAVRILARMVAIMLHAGMQILPPTWAYIGGDEQRLLSLLACSQRTAALRVGSADADLRAAIHAAAKVLTDLGMRLSSRNIGKGDTA